MKFIKLILIFTSAIAGSALADEVRFFEGGIDYWAESIDVELGASKPDLVAAVKPVATKAQASAFDWGKALDPKNDEFFKEGDYVSPAPFMEVARNPSDDNIRLWNAYIAKKNALSARLQQRMQEYALQYGNPAPMEKLASPQNLAIAAPDPARFQFRLYFDSQCPHCKNMLQTMRELAGQGFAVEVRQVDDLLINHESMPFPFTKATKEEVKRQAITSVPLLLVADSQRQLVFKLRGYKSVSSVFEELARSK